MFFVQFPVEFGLLVPFNTCSSMLQGMPTAPRILHFSCPGYYRFNINIASKVHNQQSLDKLYLPTKYVHKHYYEHTYKPIYSKITIDLRKCITGNIGCKAISSQLTPGFQTFGAITDNKYGVEILGTNDVSHFGLCLHGNIVHITWRIQGF